MPATKEEPLTLRALARMVSQAYQGNDDLASLVEVDDNEETIEPQTDSGSDLEDLVVWNLSNTWDRSLDPLEQLKATRDNYQQDLLALQWIVTALNKEINRRAAKKR